MDIGEPVLKGGEEPPLAGLLGRYDVDLRKDATAFDTANLPGLVQLF